MTRPDASNYARRAPKLRRKGGILRHGPWRAYALAGATIAWVTALAACGSADEARTGGAAERAYVPPADAAACEPGDPQRERFGTNCLCCHTGDFSIAGSVDPAGAPVARIVVTDAMGNRVEMAPDPYGNFFRHLPLTPPLTAVALGPDGRTRAMQLPAPHAACNECHRPTGVAPRIAGP